MRFVLETGTLVSTRLPSTLTMPAAMSCSAYLLEHTPILAILLLSLSVLLKDSAFTKLMKSDNGETYCASFSLSGI